MRIGIDARLWNETGVGRYTRNLVTCLQEIDQKNEYVLFSLGSDRKVIEQVITRKNFTFSPADIRWHSFSEQRHFPKIIEKEQVDVMHFPYFSVPVLYRNPFVVTIHDLILHHFATGEASTLSLPLYRLKYAAYRFAIRNAAQRAKAILTVSQATKDEILSHLGVGDKKVVVTYEGVDSAIVLPKSTKRPEVRDYFLYVGNLYPHKNVRRLLQAFEIFNKEHGDAKLIVVGKRDYFFEKFERKISQMGLSQSVQLVSGVNDATLAAYYDHAIATVMVSLMEGFGLPAVEAITRKCPVVASDIPSLREICGEGALYCNPNDISDIAETLSNAYSMSEKEKERLQKFGNERIAKYSWKDMARQTLAVYTSVAAK